MTFTLRQRRPRPVQTCTEKSKTTEIICGRAVERRRGNVPSTEERNLLTFELETQDLPQTETRALPKRGEYSGHWQTVTHDHRSQMGMDFRSYPLHLPLDLPTA